MIKRNGKTGGGDVAYTTHDGPVSRIDRRTARTGRAILRAFEDLAGTIPLDDVNVAVLAEKADINRVTFYAHYRNLGELVEEAVRAVLREAADSMQAPYADRTALADVSGNLRAYASALRKHSGLIGWIEESGKKERLHELVYEGIRDMVEARIDAMGPDCTPERKELFADYTAAGISRLVIGHLTKSFDETRLSEVFEILPKLWLPSAYEVLGIGKA